MANYFSNTSRVANMTEIQLDLIGQEGFDEISVIKSHALEKLRILELDFT